MKIIQLLDSREVGGIETHVHVLSKTLMKEQHDVHIVFTKDYGDHGLEKKFKEDDVVYSKLDGSILTLLRFLHIKKPDILHTHGYKAGIIGKILGGLLGFRVVSTYHSGDLGKGKVRLYTWLDNILSVFCTPLAVNQEIAKNLYNEVYVVKNFVDIPLQKLKKSKCSDIGFVGRLSEEKGPDIYIALAKLFPALTFHVFGNGVMEDDLKSMATENCIFHGHVDDVSQAWNKIDLLCMSSRREGLPMAALEAMASGVPVLASDIGALPDLIKTYENGFIAEAESINDFQEKITLWIKCGTARRLEISCKAHETIKNNFSAEVEIKNIISIYAKTLNGGLY